MDGEEPVNNKEPVARGLVILFGIIVLLIGIYNFYVEISTVTALVNAGNIDQIEISFSDIVVPLIIVFVGYLITIIGTSWKNIFKRLTNLFIGFALFFFTLFLIMQPMHSNAEEIANSIQPSLDYMIAASIDQVLTEQIQLREDAALTLLISEEVITEQYAVSSLTQTQADNMAQALGYEAAEDTIYLSQLVISIMYEESLNNDIDITSTPLALSTIGDQMSDYGVDLSIFSTISPDLLSNLYTLNNNAYLTILDETNTELKTIPIGNIPKTDIDLIWSNLGFSDDLSQETKEGVIKIVLSVIYTELENLNLEDTSIPLASISSQIPDDVKGILDYDIFSEDLSVRVDEISRIRTDCSGSLAQYEEICSAIMVTDYNTLMSNLDNFAEQGEGVQFSFDAAEVLEPISSIGKLENYIEEKTAFAMPSLIIYLLLMGCAFGAYYAHFRVFRRELIPIHIPYYIFKVNLIQFVPTFIILFIVHLVLTSGALLDALGKIVGDDELMTDLVLPIIPELEMYKVTIEILNQSINLAIWYLIISAILFIIFYIMLKRRFDEYEAQKAQE